MIYAFINSKGGVGKTTIAVHFAAHLSAGKKRRVIFIDADAQGSSSQWIRRAKIPVRLEQIGDPELLITKVIELEKAADDVIIDGPAGLSHITRAIMLRADRVYLPCGPSGLDYHSAKLAVAAVKEAKKVRGGLPSAALIPNKLQKRGRLTAELLHEAGKLGIMVQSGLSLRQSFADAPGQGKVVSKMGFSAKAAAREMNNLLKEITNV